jgi:hypothetical protein
MVPLETGQVTTLAKLVGVYESATDVSEGLNPLPDTTTVTPGGPDVGVSEIVGAGLVVTVNVACATSPIEKPVTWMKYEPGATLPTVNVKGDNTPLLRNVHAPGVPDAITAGVGLEIWEQGATKLPASGTAKPLPDTVTTVPTGPDDGVTVIVGPVTVNVA